jgi:hypothetical protein
MPTKVRQQWLIYDDEAVRKVFKTLVANDRVRPALVEESGNELLLVRLPAAMTAR